MRKSLILLAGILVACLPGILLAGINPNNAGLVTVDTTQAFPANDNNYYSNSLGTAVANNQGSVMCVACHTRNPANLAGSTKNSSRYMAGSHFVTRDFADTNRGGGYSDGVGTRNTAGTYIYMAKNPTIVTTGTSWRAYPRYGRLTSSAIDNDIIGGPTGANLDGAQMICYSCHNMKLNTGTSAHLLAEGAADNNSLLCISCHGDMDALLAAEWQMHPVAAGTWQATHHHRNSHSTDSDTYYKGSATQIAVGTHNMGSMTDTYYSQLGTSGTAYYQMWAAGKGTLSGSHALQWTGSRMFGSSPDNVIKPSTNTAAGTAGGGTLICTNCHRGHFGDSSTGATILRKGGTPSSEPKMGVGPYPLANAADGWSGLLRMSDRTRATTFSQNLNPNCLVCHR